MSLISCPECGKEISDKAEHCPMCGCPASEWKDVRSDINLVVGEVLSKYSENNKVRAIQELREKTGCGLKEVKEAVDAYYEQKKGYTSLQPQQSQSNPHVFKCPRCSSLNLQVVGQEIRGARDATTKGITSINLNPLKPFTIFNHKEKVVKKAKTGTIYTKWRCADCGIMFERK